MVIWIHKIPAYLCNVEVDTSNIESIKVMPKFEFESQNVTVIGTSPVALTLMENIIIPKNMLMTLFIILEELLKNL